MSYDKVGQISSINRYRDLTGTQLAIGTSYSYDSLNRLTEISHKNQANVAVASYNYSYDDGSRISQIGSVDGTTAYNYDATNQLTGTVKNAVADEAYSYDANGNRTNSGYTTGINNQLLSDGIYNYQYDNEGNRTKRTEIATSKVTEYVWDYRNRLTKVLLKDAGGVVTKTIEYSYDVNNERIGKKINGVTLERYIYDQNQISLVFDGVGNQTHRYLYGAEVDQVLADEVSGDTRWLLADYEGTIKDVVNGSGVILDHISYDSFGKVINQTSSIELRYGYTGREQDSETGLDYYRARYYDSSVGRFISEDPSGFGAGDSNLNRYVANNPISLIDSSGQEAERFVGSLLTGTTISRLLTVETGFGFESLATSTVDLRGLFGSLIPGGVKKIKKDRFVARIGHKDGAADRSYMPMNSDILGYDDKKTNDDRGHILPHLLGGIVNNADNFFWQNPSVNRGSYSQFGSQIGNILTSKHDEGVCQPYFYLEYAVDLSYKDKKRKYRPTKFSVTVTPVNVAYQGNILGLPTPIEKRGTPITREFPNP